MTSRREPPHCAYCGSAYDITRDHIPPKAIFPDDPGHRSDLITVPACRRCNHKFSIADQYFSLAVSSHMLTGENPIAATLHARAQRGFERLLRGRKGEKIRREIRLVENRTPAGILLGYRPAWKYDTELLRSVVCRIIKGLHFHHFKCPVARDVPVHSATLTDIPQRTASDDEILKPLRDTMASTPIHDIGDGVFRYRFGTALDNPDVSMWLMIFYDALEFAGSIGVPTPMAR